MNVHPERLRFFLTHSADVPKNIRFKGTALIEASALSMLIPFLATIRLLELSLDYLPPGAFDKHWASPLTSLFSNDFPVLESLTLSVSSEDVIAGTHKDLHLRACRMPRLQALDIAYIVAPSGLRGLRHLRACSCTWYEGLPELIALLRRCPHLQTLHLSYYPGWSPDNVADTEMDLPISVPRLEKLYLGGLAFAVSTLLGYIDAPGMQELVLRPIYDQYQLQYSQIRGLFLPASPAHRILPHVSWPATAELRDSLYRYEMKCTTAHQGFELHFLHNHGFDPQPTLTIILQDFVYLAAFWNNRFITELRLMSGFVERVPHAAWRDVFAACDGLENLHCVLQKRKGSLSDMWAGMTDAMSACPPREVCCPYLWYIRILWTEGISSVDHGDSELRGMKLALQTRAERGARLDELYLCVQNDEDGFSERALRELSPYVTDAHAA